MTWHVMTRDEVDRHRDLAYTFAGMWGAFQRHVQTGSRPLMRMGATQRRMFNGGVAWVLKAQQDWYALDPAVAVWELRAGDDSIFYPLWVAHPGMDAADPVIDAEHCGRPVIIHRDGRCPVCGTDITD